VVTTDLDHAECLNFGPDGACYAGGEDGQVYRFRRGEPAEVYARTGGGIGGVCLDADGRLYDCNYGRAVVHRVTPGSEVSTYSAGTADHPTIEPNYAVFDPAGFLYYSDSGSYYRPNGRLFVVTPQGATELLFGGHLHYPNGMAIDPERSWLYVVQSTASNIIRFRIEAPERLGEPEIYVTLRGVVPDGLAFAASGNLYAACYAPDVILRVRPNRGVEVVIEDPGADILNRPTNVAFEPGTNELWFANFGGHSVGSIDVGEPGAPLHLPRIR
jgi:sugar lactone lactonase YvrE